MFYHKETDTYIEPGKGFVLNDTQYLSNWLSLASEQDKLDIGLTEVVTVGKLEPEETHYVSIQYVNGEKRITCVPKPEELLKDMQTHTLKNAFEGFDRIREVVLDRLTGIAGRANWKGDKELSDLCYRTQEAVLLLKKDLPVFTKEAVDELKSRYETLKKDTATANAILESVFPVLVI